MKIEEEIKQKQFKSEYHKLAVNLQFTSKWLEAYQTRIFRDFGVSPQQYNVLRILKGQLPHPCNLLLIRERMMDKESNASRLIDKLQKSGLTERRICPKNRRQVDITITDKGIDLLDKILPKLDHLFGNLQSLNLDEAETMNKLLDKLRG